MKKFNIILLAIFFGVPAFSQDVTVQWLHGWGKDANFWRHYAPQFQNERRMVSNSPVYNGNDDDNGVVHARQVLTGRMAADPNTILIGHSMGGLVARDFERAFGAARVRGIVTVASPNQGATAANSVINGTAATVIARGVSDMTAGPYAEGMTSVSTILGGLVGLPPIIAPRVLNRYLEEFVPTDMFAGITATLNNIGSSATVSDFRSNGTYINGLNARVPEVPVVNIICEENSQSALRIANGMLFPPENANLHQYDDGAFVVTADKLKDIYRGFRVYHDAQKFAQWWRAQHHNTLANKWHRGENYLDHVHQADYNTIIGTTRYIPTTVSVLVMHCESGCDGYTPNESRVDCVVPDPGSCYYTYEQYTTYVAETTGSDGLVPVWAQRMPGIPQGNVYVAQGVNHAEASNHPEASGRYNDVFNRADRLGVLRRN